MDREDPTPKYGGAQPTPMVLAIGLARVEEKVKAIVQRMDDREERQDERDAALQASLRASIREELALALKEHVGPLEARLRVLENAKLKLVAVAGFVGATMPVIWSVAQKFLLSLLIVATFAGCASVPLPIPRGPVGPTPDVLADAFDRAGADVVADRGPHWCDDMRPVAVWISDDMPLDEIVATMTVIQMYEANGIDYLRPQIVPADQMYPYQFREGTIQVVDAATPNGELGVTYFKKYADGCMAGAILTAPGPRLQTKAHEMGHALGLDHNERPSNMMYYGADPSADGPWGILPEQLEQIR